MTKAVQASTKTANGSDHFVGLVDLRVMLVNDDGAWFAQGLELDYVAQGATLADAQKSFEKGLALTIREHLKMFGHIKQILKPAPQEVWAEFYSLSEGGRFTLSVGTKQSIDETCDDCIIFAETSDEVAKRAGAKQRTLPFAKIQYLQAAA